MNKPSKKLTVTAIHDDSSNNITAFFDDYPGLLVQGKSIDDVKDKLSSLLRSFIKRLQSVGNDFEINTKHFA
jgi:predicted RNase H-like HicB family nuclease